MKSIGGANGDNHHVEQRGSNLSLKQKLLPHMTSTQDIIVFDNAAATLPHFPQRKKANVDDNPSQLFASSLLPLSNNGDDEEDIGKILGLDIDSLLPSIEGLETPAMEFKPRGPLVSVQLDIGSALPKKMRQQLASDEANEVDEGVKEVPYDTNMKSKQPTMEEIASDVGANSDISQRVTRYAHGNRGIAEKQQPNNHAIAKTLGHNSEA